MSRWLPLAAVAAGVLFAGIGARIWFSSSVPSRCEDFVDVTLSTLPPDPTCVRLRAQAHYGVVLKQNFPGNVFVAERTEYLFPLFAENAMDERGIRVWVRAAREPEALVNLETMTVGGRLIPLTPAEIPMGAEVELGRRGGYFFEDFAMLLLADEIESDGQRWTRP